MFETGRSSVKGRALSRDPRVSICVEDDEPPFGFVRVDGIAELSDDHEELLSRTIRIAARYMGDDRAEEFGRRNATPSEMLVRVPPSCHRPGRAGRLRPRWSGCFAALAKASRLYGLWIDDDLAAGCALDQRTYAEFDETVQRYHAVEYGLCEIPAGDDLERLG